jgi:hypothetical protein
LLTKPDGFDLVAYFGYNHMGFGWMLGGGFWFVESCDACPLKSRVWSHYFFFLAAVMLSTRFGYGLPAFLARTFAAVFWAGVRDFDFLLGFFVSQTFLSFITSSS